MSQNRILLRVVPLIFVALWATGFIGAKYGLPYAEPLTFLSLRFGIVAALMLVVVLATGAPRPRSFKQVGHSLVVGILLQGFYLGGVFLAISRGMPAGLAAVIVGLQPVLTALAAKPILGERIASLQWLGIVLGFFGLVMVVFTKTGIGAGGGWGFGPAALLLNVIALIGITAASFYQKIFCEKEDLRISVFLQNLGPAILVVILAWFTETMQVDWNLHFIGALAWLVVVLSFGAFTLLMYIIRHGEISRVASLFYLVPPVAALIAYFLFGETLSGLQMVGIAVVALGVYLVTRTGARPIAPETKVQGP